MSTACFCRYALKAEVKFIKDFVQKDGFSMKMIVKLMISKLNPNRIMRNQNEHILENIFMHYIPALFKTEETKFQIEIQIPTKIKRPC